MNKGKKRQTKKQTLNYREMVVSRGKGEWGIGETGEGG